MIDRASPAPVLIGCGGWAALWRRIGSLSVLNRKGEFLS
jgi:hypothetical protein